MTYDEFIKDLLNQIKRFKAAESMEEYGKEEGKQELSEWEHTEIAW